MGWVEQDPLDIVNNVRLCVEEACKKLIDFGYSAKDIVSIGVTNQRETTVVWDKFTGEPLYNAIGEWLRLLYNNKITENNFDFDCVVWSDNRTDGTVDKILAKIPDQNKDYFKSISGKCVLHEPKYFDNEFGFQYKQVYLLVIYISRGLQNKKNWNTF